MNKFLEEGDEFTFPNDFPQSKEIVLEQLKILKSLLKAPKCVNSEPSTATTSTKGNCANQEIKKITKSTNFVPSVDSTATFKNNEGNMVEKLNRAAPYYVFFTKVPKAPKTLKQDYSITFTGISTYIIMYCKLNHSYILLYILICRTSLPVAITNKMYH